MKQAAIFLDRDNTLIEDPGYLADPNQVKLLPGVTQAIKRWNESGYQVVVVTNQSGLARGLITEKQLNDIHDRLESLLEAENAKVDAIYYCPYLEGPEAIVRKFKRDSKLRKPKPGMLIKAAEEMGLDLDYSWMVGDAAEDMQAGLAAGCKTVLLSSGQEAEDEGGADYIVDSLPRAADVVLNGEPTSTEIPKVQRATLTTNDQDPPMSRDEELDVLKDIRSLLQQQRRDSAQKDFSLTRLGATLSQILAISILLWGVAAYLSTDQAAAALLRFALAGAVQLIALTLYITDDSNQRL